MARNGKRSNTNTNGFPVYVDGQPLTVQTRSRASTMPVEQKSARARALEHLNSLPMPHGVYKSKQKNEMPVLRERIPRRQKQDVVGNQRNQLVKDVSDINQRLEDYILNDTRKSTTRFNR
eukprot:UN25770